MTGWEYVIYAIISAIVSYGISMAMAPKPKKPASGQLDVPTAEEGGSVPVCFGTNLVKQSNVVSYGLPSTTPIKSKGGKK